MAFGDRIKAIRLAREAVASGLTDEADVLEYVADRMGAGNPGAVDFDKLISFIMEIIKMLLPLLIKKQAGVAEEEPA